jgi:hypothetical protein
MIGFIPHLYTLKNPAFREEKEWRLIALGTPGNPLGAIINGHQPTSWELRSVDYYAKPDRLVPFRALSIQP